MSVKAKFKCDSITSFEHCKKVDLSAVYSNVGENADFTKYTPSGNLSINIDNTSAASDYFNPGEEYYITFDKVTK